jgi:DNA helicase-2/ATP-dependent DNA helicase PcrA
LFYRTEEDHIEPFEVLEGEGLGSKDPVADFLEYCSLCSNQKELEEAEGGVRLLMLLFMT